MKIEAIRLALLGPEAASDLRTITESPFGIGSFYLKLVTSSLYLQVFSVEDGNFQIVL